VGVAGVAATTSIVWAMPLIRLSENPIGSCDATLTGMAPPTATPSTSSVKYGHDAPVNTAEISRTTL
jgi:hypothetical protein